MPSCIFLSILISCANCSYADYSLSDFPHTNILETLDSKYTGRTTGNIPLKKREFTQEEIAKMRNARARLKEKKIPVIEEEVVLQTKKNHYENVKLLLDAGITPNAEYYGEYALHYALKKNKTEIATLLLQYGATPDFGFDSSLWWAVKHKNLKLVETLIEYGANVNYTDIVSSKSVLYLSVKKKYYEIAKILLQNGAKIDPYTASVIEKNRAYDKLNLIRPKEQID